MNIRAISTLFWVAALYDGLLGIAFLTAPARLYAAMGIPGPNHPGYIQFPAALLIVFAIGFAMVARRPHEHRGIIVLGMLLKTSYAAVVLGHFASGGIPTPWTVFAWIDLAFLLAFAAAWRALADRSATAGATA